MLRLPEVNIDMSTLNSIDVTDNLSTKILKILNFVK